MEAYINLVVIGGCCGETWIEEVGECEDFYSDFEDGIRVTHQRHRGVQRVHHLQIRDVSIQGGCEGEGPKPP